MIVCYQKHDYHLKNSFSFDKRKKGKAVPKLN